MQRILALDVGERRIGVAVSDPLGIIARTLGVVQRKTDAAAIAQLAALVDEHDARMVVVGLPRSMSGEIGRQAREVLDFAAQLEAVIDVPIEMWDERLSTVTAARVMTERGQSAREQRQTIDAVAAAVILQDYLDAQRARASLMDQHAEKDE